jgi:hypothetical protein
MNDEEFEFYTKNFPKDMDASLLALKEIFEK